MTERRTGGLSKCISFRLSDHTLERNEGRVNLSDARKASLLSRVPYPFLDFDRRRATDLWACVSTIKMGEYYDTGERSPDMTPISS